MSDQGVLADRIEVQVRGKNYTFRVPSISYDIEVGYRAAAIRRAASPESGGQVGAVDWAAITASRTFAIMELYLSTSDEQWPFSAGADGKPTVDSAKFPVNKTKTAYEIGRAFEVAFERFCDDGTADAGSAGQEAVAGQ